jgi:hypothetical protein
MGSNCPSHSAQPLGGKPNEKILISLKNGSAMPFSPFDPAVFYGTDRNAKKIKPIDMPGLLTTMIKSDC